MLNNHLLKMLKHTTSSKIKKHMVNNNDKPQKERRIKHYSNKQKILLVGEGDFSFAACLAKFFRNAGNMIATSRDSKEKLELRYGDAESNLDFLKEKGCVLLYGVDALTMTKLSVLRNQRFDRIVFNFPHAHLLYREHDENQIKLHQELVLGFFKSAYKLLAINGEIHITHKTAQPFDRWNIKELATEAGLYLVDEVCFDKRDYPGYHNKKGEGHGIRCNKTFPVGASSTFKFSKLLYGVRTSELIE